MNLPTPPAGEVPAEKIVPEKTGLCARCQSPNVLSRTHCELCGARLPWLPPSVEIPLLYPPISSVKIWPFLSSESQKMQHALSGLGDFLATQSCLGVDKRSGLAIDESTKKLCLLKVVGEKNAAKIERRIFRYPDILGSEIVEDGYIVASTSGRGAGLPSSRQPPRGLNNLARNDHTVELVAFKLVLNAVTEMPQQVKESEDNEQQKETLIHIVRFLHKSTPREGHAHKTALAKAHDWHRLIIALMQLVSIQSPSRPR